MVNLVRLTGFIVLITFGSLFQSSFALATSYEVEIVATVPGCGDGVIQSGEQCDGGNLGGSSCSLLGFTSGSLSCSTACTFVTAACVLVPESGAGSTRTTTVVPDEQYIPATNLVVNGYAEPTMRVQLLLDGVLVATTIASMDGKYQTTVSGLGVGIYRLQMVGVSSYTSQASPAEVAEVRIVESATTKVSQVVIPATFSVEQINNNYVIRGLAVPGSVVTPIMNTEVYDDRSTLAGLDGSYQITVIAAAPKVITLNIRYPDQPVSFTTRSWSSPSVKQVTPVFTCGLGFDLNNDCAVNVIDFQMARWVYIFNPASLYFDFNDSQTLDIVDFSIMAYYWTG